MKKRVVGYDIIKSMAMFFVVMLHYSFLHEILFQRACWNGGHRIVRGVRAIVLRCERRAASSSEDG